MHKTAGFKNFEKIEAEQFWEIWQGMLGHVRRAQNARGIKDYDLARAKV